MEASEKPQLPLDDGIDQGAVRAIGDRLVIERLDASPTSAPRASFASGPRPASRRRVTIAKAIEIGARVLDTEETAANVDYVRAEFERHAASSARAARRRRSSPATSSSPSGSPRPSTVLATARCRRRSTRMLSEALEEQRTKLCPSCSRPRTARTRSRLQGSRRPRSQGARRAPAERGRGEPQAHRGAAARGDRAPRARGRRRAGGRPRPSAAPRRASPSRSASTRRSSGSRPAAATARRTPAPSGAEGGGKKGDTLIELGAGEGPSAGRIVFEAKDKKLSKNAAWTELNGGMAARAASFGVLVVAGEDQRSRPAASSSPSTRATS